MLRLALAGLAAICVPVAAAAQDDSNARVLAAVDGFLGALNSRDPVAMAAVVLPEGYTTVLVEREGPDRTRSRTLADGIATINQEQSVLNEVYWDPMVLVQGPIAVVWAPYSFDVDGERSHCGIDVFNLLRVDGEWKVASITYTADPDGCPAGR